MTDDRPLRSAGHVDDGGAPSGVGAASGGGATSADRPASGDAPVSGARFVSTDRPVSGHRASSDDGPSGHDRPTRGADPVKALMDRHRELCARAVDPLEIAAALETYGVTDRTAGRFRHRDVFSLAEEMYARASHGASAAPRENGDAPPCVQADWVLLSLLPGALCAAAVTWLRLDGGDSSLLITGVGVLAVALGVRLALSRGPLSTGGGPMVPTPSATRGWTYWLLTCALFGDGLLEQAISGGPDGLPGNLGWLSGGLFSGAGEPVGGGWPVSLAPVLALSLACAPGAWCAHLFTVGVHRKLVGSRVLKEFAGTARPLLLSAVLLFLAALTGLLALCGTVLGEPGIPEGAVALGGLLFLARLLTVHRFTRAPAVMLGTAGMAQAAALASVFAGRLPGCDFLGVPVTRLALSCGPDVIPALACGGAALVLLVHAARTLVRASAHAPDSPSP